ncbi:hypothetical protein [Cellulomonas bogoriensis]|uniref:hypothetical protein n=1 Tax=Cellulomonas bogoriensis TaxID=301388 RepID=UPI00068FE6EA|nr:hypothetical protein [Cellulomonas bogoriensis]
MPLRDQRLDVIGASASAHRAIGAAVAGVGAAVGCLVALLVAGVVAQSYLAIASAYRLDLSTVLVLTTGAAAVVTITTLAGWVDGDRGSG